MADDTYGALVYHKQGSTAFVVASSGLVEVESGGAVQVQSGGAVTVQSGGSMDLESGGGIDIESGADVTVELGGAIVYPVNGATSSGFNGSSSLSTQSGADGLTFLTSSGANTKITLPAPYLGAHKTIYNTAGSTGMVQYIAVGSGADGVGIVTTGADSTAHMMINEGTTSGALAGWCQLVGLSNTRWVRTAFSPTSQWVIVSTSS